MLTPSRFSLAASFLILGSLPLHAQATFRASVSNPGFQCAGSLSIGRPRSLADDGRSVLISMSSVVSSNGTAFGSGAFLREATQGVTRLLSTNLSGAPAATWCYPLAIDGFGTMAVFRAVDTGFVPQPSGVEQILVANIQGGTLEVVSVGANGELPGALRDAAVSADGRFVAFQASGALIAADTNNDFDVYVRDRLTGSLTLASLNSAGAPLVYSTYPQYQAGIESLDISDDGSWLVYCSVADNVLPNSANGTWVVGCRNLRSGAFELINVDLAGGPSQFGAKSCAMSGDGRVVAFLDASPNLVPGGAGGSQQLYARDRWLETTELVSVSTSGGPANDASYDPAVSYDGRYVAFVSRASNLVPNDGYGTVDVFVRDRVLGTTRRVNIGADNLTLIGGVEILLGISADGSRVAFSATGATGVPGDTNAASDVFVRDLAVAASPMANYCVAKPFSGGCVAALSVTGIPDTSGATAFQISATGLFGSVSGLNASRMSALAWSFGAPPPPYTPGSLCVAAPVNLLPRRLTGFHVGSCGGWYAETISPALMASLGWTPGTTIYTQLYVREPAAANYALSQGVSFVVR
jgi:Tol biopolymer transport system component